MSNNQNSGTGAPNNPYDKEALEQGLNKRPITSMTYVGPEWSCRCSQFQTEIVNAFNDRLGITSASDCLIFPDKISRDDTSAELKCIMYFYAKDSKEIWRVGGNGDTRKSGTGISVVNIVNSNVGGKNRFEASDDFKKKMAAFAAEFDENDDIVIRSLPNRRGQRDNGDEKYVAVIELDFAAVMAWNLQIKSDDQYDFSYDIISTKSYRNINDANYEDALLVVKKYVAPNRKPRRKNQRVNYRAFASDVMSAYSRR